MFYHKGYFGKAHLLNIEDSNGGAVLATSVFRMWYPTQLGEHIRDFTSSSHCLPNWAALFFINSNLCIVWFYSRCIIGNEVWHIYIYIYTFCSDVGYCTRNVLLNFAIPSWLVQFL